MTKKKRSHRALQRKPVERGADGKVHLLLHRDHAGNEQVTLSAPVFGEAWLDELAVGTINTTLAIFGERPSFERAAALAQRVMAATSRLTESLLLRAEAGAVACRAGCDHCCHQSVGVTPPEALAIVAHLKQTLSADELAALSARMAERVERTRGLSADERFSPQLPCSFLRDGRCSIYDVRPLVCRGMNSLDADDCARRLRDAAARAEFLARGTGGHCFVEPIQASQAVSAGLQLCGAELYALDMRPLELTAAVSLLLGADGAVERAWLGGEPWPAAAAS